MRIYVLDTAGKVRATIVRPVQFAPGTHFARFVREDMRDPELKFQGSLVVTADENKKFAITALVQNRGRFTAIPVVAAKPAVVP